MIGHTLVWCDVPAAINQQAADFSKFGSGRHIRRATGKFGIDLVGATHSTSRAISRKR